MADLDARLDSTEGSSSGGTRSRSDRVAGGAVKVITFQDTSISSMSTPEPKDKASGSELRNLVEGSSAVLPLVGRRYT